MAAVERVGRGKEEYLEFFRLGHNPFPVAPDDRYFFASEDIEQIVAEIVHGICSRKGFFILTGDIGLGKTTISRRIMALLEKADVETALILHTSVQGADLLRSIIEDFGLNAQGQDAGSSVAELMRRLNRFVLDVDRQGKNCAIIIDDAQNLSVESLELVRMISNLEANQKKLVQILLVGQPELEDLLSHQCLRQLDSRIMLRKSARPLKKKELADYLAFKLTAAGNHGQVQVTRAAVNSVYRYSKGNLRRINSLMDRCFYAAFARGSRRLDRSVVSEAAADLRPARRAVLQTYRRPLATALACLLLVTAGYLNRDLLRQGAAFMKAGLPDTARAALADADISYKIRPQPVVSGSNLDTAIGRFLKCYGLERYTAELKTAIENGRLQELALRIMGATGWQMVKLAGIPGKIEARFNILRFEDRSSGAPARLLFWRPPVVLRHFYYDYKGAEIVALQHALAKLGYYKGSLDGLVGRGLMRAVVDFQRSSGLQVTGRPDPETVFLMFNGQEKILHG